MIYSLQCEELFVFNTDCPISYDSISLCTLYKMFIVHPQVKDQGQHMKAFFFELLHVMMI